MRRAKVAACLQTPLLGGRVSSWLLSGKSRRVWTVSYTLTLRSVLPALLVRLQGLVLPLSCSVGERRLSVLLVAQGARTDVCSLPLTGAVPGSCLSSQSWLGSFSPGLDVNFWEVSLAWQLSGYFLL